MPAEEAEIAYIHNWQELDRYGINALTGESCAYSMRMLCDLNERGVKTMGAYFGIPVYDYALWDVHSSHPGYDSLSKYRDYAAYVIVSAGPDRDIDMGRMTNSWPGDCKALDQRTDNRIVYTATNGTISSGDIIATNKEIFD